MLVRPRNTGPDGYTTCRNGDWKILRSHDPDKGRPARPRGEDIRLWRDGDIAGTEMLRALRTAHRYPAHSHDEFVIATFEAGAQHHTVASRPGLAVPGSVMVISPGEVHTGEPAAQAGMWSYRAFYPKTEVLEEIAEDLFGRQGIHLDFGRRPLWQDREAATHLSRMHARIEGARDPLEKQDALLSAFAPLIRRYGQSSTGTARRQPPAGNVGRAIDLIHACFEQRLTTADIARSVGLSDFHFMRSFKEKTGMTVHAYLTQVRLQAAKDRLAAGLSPAETATSVGFFDQSHFTNHFRTSFGVTPRRFAASCC